VTSPALSVMAHSSCIDLTPGQKSQLLTIARQSIALGIRTQEPLLVRESELVGIFARELGIFVTLKQADQLRGCIGSLDAKQPLVRSVAVAAFHAAFRDPRFTPLAVTEIEQTQIEISVLSGPEPIVCGSEADLLATLKPDEDGLLLEDRGQRATFLPQVWERLTDPENFVRELKRKAGWSENYWSSTIQAYRYRSTSFTEVARP
jgi:AmmeMemoRadiSam system protein A